MAYQVLLPNLIFLRKDVLCLTVLAMHAMPSKIWALQSNVACSTNPEAAESQWFNSSQHPEVSRPAEAPGSALSAVGPCQPYHALHKKKQELAAYATDQNVDSSSQEVSFEELRAARWFAKQAVVVKQV